MTAPLVSATELAELLDRAPPALLDVRWELAIGPRRDLYEQGHLPGATFVDLDADLAGPPGACGRHPLPALEAFQASMRAAAVDSDRGAVVYDAANSTAAARAWWLLRYFGHEHVRILDGGLDAWVRAGFALEAGPRECARSGDFSAAPGGMPVLDAAGAARLALEGVLLDARATERFRGESEPIDPVAGHIPGARNRPTSANVGPSGEFLAASELRAGFVESGLGTEAPVGAYCGSGVSAAHEVLALELAGFPEAALYPGSWSEWVTDPSRPVATGP
jgi:thiosulfate/3-mercaptopyruvate sulfurtransferase